MGRPSGLTSLLAVGESILNMLHQRTMVWNEQESRRKYWVTRSAVCSFVRLLWTARFARSLRSLSCSREYLMIVCLKMTWFCPIVQRSHRRGRGEVWWRKRPEAMSRRRFVAVSMLSEHFSGAVSASLRKPGRSEEFERANKNHNCLLNVVYGGDDTGCSFTEMLTKLLI